MNFSLLLFFLLVVCQAHLAHCCYGSNICWKTECCNEDYIKNDVKKFESLFSANVFGQPLVKETIANALRWHFKAIERSQFDPDLSPKSPLVLSFHGGPGCGKNYVARFIAESLFEKGWDSKFVNHFSGTYDFPNKKTTEVYKKQIQNWIRGNVSECAQSLLIFDEIDKMERGIIEAISPFIDSDKSIKGIDFRKSIFIFLSNTGGKLIENKVTDRLSIIDSSHSTLSITGPPRLSIFLS